MAIVMGDIEESLFSVVAQKSSQQIRLEHVKRLASRLTEILNSVKSVCNYVFCRRGALLTRLNLGMPR